MNADYALSGNLSVDCGCSLGPGHCYSAACPRRQQAYRYGDRAAPPSNDLNIYDQMRPHANADAMLALARAIEKLAEALTKEPT